MFNFSMKQPTATTVASTTPNSTFIFNPSRISQPQNAFGTLNTSQPYIFGAGVQNTSTSGPFSNSLSNSMGPSIFGTNQPAPVAQPNNMFASNLTGTTVKFNPVSGQEILESQNKQVLKINTKLHCICAMKEYLNKSMDELRMEDYQSNRKYVFVNSISGSTKFSSAFAPPSTASTTANIFGSNNTPTTAASLFSTTRFNTPGGPVNQPFSTAPAPSANPFTTGANIFGPATSTVVNPFNTATSIAPVATSGSSWTTAQPSPFNTTANANTSTQFQFGPQPNTGTNLFPQPTTTTTTAPPNANSFFIQPTVPTTASFPFATSLSYNNAPPMTTTTTASTLNPPMWPGLNVTGTQPAVTSSSSTLLSQAPKQEQKTEQTASIIQQNFLAASLLDPYANRGKKDFTNMNQIQAPAESTIVSTVSAPTNTTTITTTTPIPVTLPIQSNLRKVAPSRSLVDLNFKLRPVSSSPALNEDLKPSKQPSMVSSESVKSGLSGNFTDEEELVLLSRTKMSKLRLSNDVIDAPSQFNSISSLYPVRRLAEMEKLNNITRRPSTPPITTTTTTVQHERTSHSASNSRDVSPNPRFTPSVNPKQLYSPIVQRKSSDQNYRLPILTRDNYYMKPTVSELKSLFNDKGQCILKKFTVGHEKYGSVTFYGQINVAGLNLDEIIEINRHEVTVYHDDDHKPPVGEELNLPARITLFGVYPVDRTTQEEIKDIERIKAANYDDHLREITKKFDGEFINYEMKDGSWTFMVKHFTRYGLGDDQDGFVIQS